jgi:hypothetical protein
MVEEKILHLQDRYSLHDTWTCVTVRVTRWIYHGPRVQLTIVEGFHNSSEQIDKAIDSFGKNAEFPEYPKHMEIVCRPEEMLELAKTITEICDQKK